MPANISTRGSAESVLGLIVVSALALVLKRRYDAAAVVLGLAVHFKIYPFIYGASILALLRHSPSPPSPYSSGRRRLFTKLLSWAQVRFAVISIATFAALGGLMYGIWGHSFLQHTYFYHLTRRDHRHNFSLYFYPTYLNYSSSSSSKSPLQNPLVSFIPQMALSIGTGFMFGKDDITLAWFVQTACFVTFNKVCTSQYFMWYLWFLPLILPRLRLSFQRAGVLIAVWVGVQALWLSIAYKLEFLGEPVFFSLWAASALFLVANAWVLVEVVHAYG
ncbi:glycosyltransferase family 50 protein [Hydnum rufescens UP504]|uniref:GPI mannosyltransferase 1 n=1 Tax=Hydnum rufescens UP504 TaxID=1448309 RepID=A0A9P6BAL2_9AGAM|nr:glycosyltransferase family 50 protein [Hydnum rufescens UP504]